MNERGFEIPAPAEPGAAKANGEGTSETADAADTLGQEKERAPRVERPPKVKAKRAPKGDEAWLKDYGGESSREALCCQFANLVSGGYAKYAGAVESMGAKPILALEHFTPRMTLADGTKLQPGELWKMSVRAGHEIMPMGAGLPAGPALLGLGAAVLVHLGVVYWMDKKKKRAAVDKLYTPPSEPKPEPDVVTLHS